MFAQSRRRMTSTLAVGCVSIMVLAGCNGSVTITPPSIDPPSIPAVDIDMTKSLDEQLAEVKKFYCKYRMTPLGEGVATQSKQLWDELVGSSETTTQLKFDPDDPNTCNGF